MAFPDSFLDELAGRNDIVDIVSGYVPLSLKSGSYWGCCPFHSEKTPSFHVLPDRQTYHCFGCGKGGGVINFIMEIENLSFRDAVEVLANRAGLPLPDDSTEEHRGRRTRMLELNRDAARWFHEQLGTPQGRAAVEYIEKRGISRQMVTRFGLGAAPEGWSNLTDAMVKRGYSVGELLDAGLVKKGQKGGVYDTFRNRLMFPVIDVRGAVIGFSGRILGDGEPKYLNSPDTLVFNKSKNLFALNLAKKSKRGMIILAEGNVDVVALHQAGFDCAVASLGTSLTPDQARLMTRYTKNVVISYDSDAAGVKAAQRAIGILEKVGLGVKVLRMDGAKDPDEFIKKKGADAFGNLMERSENHIEYRLLTAKEKHDMETDEGRVAFFSEAAEILSTLQNAVEREVYGARVAEWTGVSAEAVASEVKRARTKRARAEKKREERENLRPAAMAQPKDRSIRYSDEMSAVAEEGVVRLLMLDPQLRDIAGKLSQGDFTSPFLGKVFNSLIQRIDAHMSVSVAALSQELEPAEVSRLTEIMQKPESGGKMEQAMADYINKIRSEKLKKAAPTEQALLETMMKYRETKGFGG